MKNRVLLIVACVVISLLASSCKEEVVDEPITDGYFQSGQVQTGGDAFCEQANAKSLEVRLTNRDGVSGAQIEFTFVSGSIITDSTEETSCNVPSFSIYTLSNPYRLVIDIHNLEYSDYRRSFEPDGQVVLGSFEADLFASERTLTILHLASPVRFLASADGDTLSIYLKDDQPPESSSFFVTANAYEEYLAGTIALESDLSPCLASDYSSVLLISRAFDTLEEAEEYKRLSASLYPSIASDVWRVVELAPGELPEYDRLLDHLETYQTPVVRLPGGDERVLPVLVPDGLYLCDMPNQGGILYSKQLYDDADEGEYQQLHILQNDGGSVLATPFEFAAIEEAFFSPDGRKLAVLERTSAMAHLYVFDADTFELLNDLSEMGFGQNTDTFIWDSLGNTIYAIAGDSDQQLHSFDYSIPDETQRHALIDRNSIDEGSLGFTDGELYFTMATMEEGSMIFRIKPEGGVRKPFIKGSRFSISADQEYMAIANTSEASASGASANAFELYNFASGQTVTITDEFFPYDFLWSNDCTRLYYIESKVSGGQTESETSDVEQEETVDNSEHDPYPYTLWMYDINSREATALMDLCAPDIFPAQDNNSLYLNITGDDSARAVRASYLLNLTEVFIERDNITMTE